MLLKIGFEDFIRLVNQKVSGRETDYEYGQIYYKINYESESIYYVFYYGDEVWKYKTEISIEDFKNFYGVFEDFEMKYKPIKIISIGNIIRLKVVE